MSACPFCDGDGYSDIVDDWGGVVGPKPCEECGGTGDRGNRVRMDLDGGYMDVRIAADATPETIAALKALGQAAVDRMAHDAPAVSVSQDDSE